MLLSYDPRYNVAYLRFREAAFGDPPAQVDTIHVGDELSVDLAPDGTVYGVGLLDANAQLRAADGGSLVVVNEADDARQVVPLAD